MIELLGSRALLAQPAQAGAVLAAQLAALLPICLERNVSTQLCEASFPHTSNAAHTTGAAAYLAAMPPAERAVLREAVFRLYPRDVAIYQRYRRDQRDDPARSKDQSE